MQGSQGVVIISSDKDYVKNLGRACIKHKPQACLEAISGKTTGMMLEFMGFGSTLIVYGLLSDLPAGAINSINFIGKAQTIESFLLTNWLMR